MQERRQNVRVRPAHDSAVEVVALMDGLRAPLDIIDVSIGGFGFLIRQLAFETGAEVRLEIAFPRHDPFEARAAIRHVHSGAGKDMAGVQLLELEPEQAKLVRRYVAEMLERGLLR